MIATRQKFRNTVHRLKMILENEIAPDAADSTEFYYWQRLKEDAAYLNWLACKNSIEVAS